MGVCVNALSLWPMTALCRSHFHSPTTYTLCGFADVSESICLERVYFNHHLGDAHLGVGVFSL